MREYSIFVRFVFALFLAHGLVQAGHVEIDTTLNGERIELHVLAAEPFFTKQEVSAGKAAEGMMIVAGAKPVMPDAATHPNHHLVIHVFNAKTGNVIANAKVKMSFRPLDEKGNPSGVPKEVPIVVMQAIGKGEQSTHYGNNVSMAPGSYAVAVAVNGKKIDFKIKLSETPATSMDEMQMK